ncbi:DUF222 domain-containing protein [Nocardioides marmoribigeumensis]|uniref:HNH endonuclease n=1 Tax=Nocardioides marmoribigeumensis TaxID=433649 RepID=A0ABU2BY34_9ACTN|nr:DUF222 domain-containing protein [Nocardioides marmoribigeumensis]MDR7363320.1 hypothetical protein [Nocardioides marmoribigeumensis]
MTAAAATDLGPEWVQASLAADETSRDARSTLRRGLLDRVAQRRADIRAAEADELVAVTEWADLHRTDAADHLLSVAAGMLPAPRLAAWATCPVDMSGVPVDEYALAELATTLQVPDTCARELVEDALELRERLPRSWARVIALAVPVWKARLLARRTRTLSPEAAEHVDRHLAAHLHKLSTTRIKAAVDAAVLRFDPDRAQAEADQAGESRGVWFEFEPGSLEQSTGTGGTARFGGVADTPDVLAFKDALTTKAAELEVLGDESSEQVRMAKAVGIIADPQYSLDLSAAAHDALETQGDGDRRPPKRRGPLGLERPIHIHLHTSTETARVQTSGLPWAASPVSTTAIERWISELAPGVRVKVTPVVNLNDHHAVDEHEAPAHIKDRVDLRDHLCVFPFCNRRVRADRDHIDPFVPIDDGGPPGQTGDLTLARLCRYHHRVKTHGGWRYRRLTHDPGAYQWVSPLGDHYLVDGTGTTPLT